LASWLSYHAVGYLNTGKLPKKEGSSLSRIVPYKAYKTKDSYVVIGVPNDNMWKKFRKVLGEEELFRKEFDTNKGRVEHKEEVNGLIEKKLAVRETEEWV